jgi:hypothetical protein
VYSIPDARHIGKSQLPGGHDLVAEETAASHGGRVVERSALHQKYVEVAVAVVIQQRYACAHDLGHIELARCSGGVSKIQACLRRAVSKLRA